MDQRQNRTRCREDTRRQRYLALLIRYCKVLYSIIRGTLTYQSASSLGDALRHASEIRRVRVVVVALGSDQSVHGSVPHAPIPSARRVAALRREGAGTQRVPSRMLSRAHLDRTERVSRRSVMRRLGSASASRWAMYAVCGRSIGLTSSVRRAPSAAMRSTRSAADASEYAMSEPSTTSYAPAVQGGCHRVEASCLRGRHDLRGAARGGRRGDRQPRRAVRRARFPCGAARRRLSRRRCHPPHRPS